LPGFDRPKASDVLGELVVRAWLSTALPADVAARAAAGWGGDRAAIYAAGTGNSPDGGIAPEPPLLWLTIWDDGGEADDFSRAAAAVAGDANVTRRGEAVAVFFGAAELAQPALEGTLDGWKAVSKPAAKGGRPRRAAQSGCQRRDRAAAPR
jgi:hypothetical protein